MSVLPKTITATVSAKAIDKTSRFYNASLKDIIIELFQNSRRAGATQIIVKLHDNKIIIHDNGQGISDPSTILSFGESKWAGNIAKEEDSAGMGFFALSNYTTSIHSISKDTKTGWCARLTPKSFSGQKEVSIKKSPINSGTRIDIETHKARYSKADIKELSKHLGIKVAILDYTSSYNRSSYTILPTPFTQQCVATQKTQFGTIGIVLSHTRRLREDNINFHGCTLKQTLPKRENLEIIYDIQNAQHIKLVLPSRKDIIKDSMWDKFYRDSLKFLYEHIAQKQNHTLSYNHYQEALSLGVNIKPSQNSLKLWTPCAAQEQYYNSQYEKTSKYENAIIYSPDAIDPIKDQLLALGLKNNRSWNPTIFESDSSSEGYEWYDKIPEITDIQFIIKSGEDTAIIKDFETSEALINGTSIMKGKTWTETYKDPENVYIMITLSNGVQREIETGIIVMGEHYDVENMNILLTPKAKEELDTCEIEELVYNSYFIPSDDSEAESYYTQEQDYRQRTKLKVLSYFHTPLELLHIELMDIILEHVQYSIPKDIKLELTAYNPRQLSNKNKLQLKLTQLEDV